jgi:hypothetical protein
MVYTGPRDAARIGSRLSQPGVALLVHLEGRVRYQLASVCRCCAQLKDAMRPEGKRRCCAIVQCAVTRCLPAPRKNRRAVWTVDEARRFLESARHDQDVFYAAYVLILVLGLRKGEVLGPTWDRINLDSSELYVGSNSSGSVGTARGRHAAPCWRRWTCIRVWPCRSFGTARSRSRWRSTPRCPRPLRAKRFGSSGSGWTIQTLDFLDSMSSPSTLATIGAGWTNCQRAGWCGRGFLRLFTRLSRPRANDDPDDALGNPEHPCEHGSRH